ncbi:MAG: BPSL0067 family protein [Candidatus Pacebacteria bacterium]|nr:BPSL0067 family protein [Candidatus Paceibacterota bacterium]
MNSKKTARACILLLVFCILCATTSSAQAAREFWITDNNYDVLDNSAAWTSYSYGYLLLWPNSLSVSSQTVYSVGSISATKVCDGECVSFVKHVSGVFVSTSNWEKGSSLFTYNLIRPGTAIATFWGTGNSYGGHTAIFVDYYYENGERTGIIVWDQNFLPDHGKVVAKHIIRRSGSGLSDADNYYTVLIP